MVLSPPRAATRYADDFRRTYELYLDRKARQAITSAATDRKAPELLSGEGIRQALKADAAIAAHSPFARARYCPTLYRAFHRVVSDYAADLAKSPLGPFWTRDARFVIPAPDPASLREIVLLPAASLALELADFDEVDSLVADVHQTPHPLPLLSCTLSELFEAYVARGDGSRSLRLPPDFEQSGGVAASLGRSGDDLIAGLPAAEDVGTLEKVLLRFVSREGGQPARRRVSRDELEFQPPDDGRCRRLLPELLERRLLVSGESDTGITTKHATIACSPRGSASSAIEPQGMRSINQQLPCGAAERPPQFAVANCELPWRRMTPYEVFN